MSTFEARIREASDRNAALLRSLAETDYAPPALEEQQRFISDLEKELGGTEQHLKRLAGKRRSELKDHERYRDSNVRRFMYKATGQKEKFSQKAEKEEREYFEVLQAEHQATQLKNNLQEQLNAAVTVRADLEATARAHTNAQQELDHMYHDLFSGPTPQFPEEDAKERASNEKLSAYHDVRMRMETATNVIQLLSSALPLVQKALMHIRSALNHSRADLFGGGAMHDFIERQELAQTEMAIQQARNQVDRARRSNPSIPAMPPININHGDIMTDVLFDNIFTDMAFHEEIKRGQFEVIRFGDAVEKQLQAAQARQRDLTAELRRKETELENARQELQRERERAFERYAGQQGTGGVADVPPPAYAVSPSSVAPPPGPPPNMTG